MTPTSTAPTLRSVLSAGTSRLIEVAHAPNGLDLPIDTVSLYDPESKDPASGELVLAVGLRCDTTDLEQLLRGTGPRAVVAVRCRNGDEIAWLRRRATRYGTTVLAIAPGLSWDRLHALARTSVAAGAASQADPGDDDLYAFADSAAMILGAPVIIDDAAFNVIAYSSDNEGVDAIRLQSIIQRRPPQDFLDWCEENKILEHLNAQDDPVRITAGGAIRLVCAIRTSGELLGYLWAVRSDHRQGSLSEQKMRALVRVAATHILRARTRRDYSRSMREDLLRQALLGRGDAATTDEWLRPAGGRPFRVLTFRRTDDGGGAGGVHALRNLIVTAADSVSGPSTVTELSGRLYVLLPATEVGVVAAMAAEIVETAAQVFGAPLQVLVSAPLVAVDGLADARTQLDRLSTAGLGEAVVFAERALVPAFLAELTDFVLSRPNLLSSGMVDLVRSDRESHTDYVRSLSTYFECGGNLTEAAARLFIHRNTLKYRLNRIAQVFGIDLDDPQHRLVNQVQLAVLTSPGAEDLVQAAHPLPRSVPEEWAS